MSMVYESHTPIVFLLLLRLTMSFVNLLIHFEGPRMLESRLVRVPQVKCTDGILTLPSFVILSVYYRERENQEAVSLRFAP